MSLADILDLEDFRERTPMFIGSWEIDNLFLFLSAINFSIINYGIDDECPLIGFLEWLEEVKGYRQSGGKGWHMLIAENNELNSKKAILMKFFDLYDEFKGR